VKRTGDPACRRPARFPAVTYDQMSLLFGGARIAQCCIVRLEGRLDFERLRRAMRLSLEAEPFLSCRFVEGRFGPHWEVRDDVDRLDLCAMEHPATEEERERRVLAFAAADTSATTDPLVRAVVLRREDDTLCLTLHHAAGDGTALKAYTGLVASIYRRLAGDPAYIPTANPSRRRDIRPFLAGYGLAGRFALLARSLRALRRLRGFALWNLPASAGGPASRRLALRRLPRERMERVAAYCRERGAMTNELLLAAMFLAFRRHAPGPPARHRLVAMPIDLRPRLRNGQPRVPATLASLMLLPLPDPPDETLDTAVSLVRDILFETALATDAGLACMPVFLELPPVRQLRALIPPPVVRAIGRREHARMTGVNRLAVYLSNLGEIDAASVRFDGTRTLDAFLTASGAMAYGFMASSFDGTLTLSYVFDEAVVDLGLASRVLDTMVALLPE